MNEHAAVMRQCLRDIDINGMRRLAGHVFPAFPAGEDRDVEAAIHLARTSAEWLALKARAYSHRWLSDRGLPSGLPDHLKPKAERLYPRIVAATGFAANFKSALLRPIKEDVEAAVHAVILDAYATDKPDSIDHDKLRGHMLETKDRAIASFVGRARPA